MLYRSNTTLYGSVTRAFGLVELLVCIGIMLLVISVTVTRQSSFNGAVLLRNQAYELAFTIRQAQLLAVSGGDESADARSYGVYVSTASAKQTEYILFQDKNFDGKYNGAANEQIGLTGQLDSRFEIRNIYYDTDQPISNGYITFTRPNFDAKFCGGSGACSSSGLPGPFYIDIARAGITTNGFGDVRRVEVSGTGQISVVTY